MPLTVIQAQKRFRRQTPVVVMVDLQREHVLPARRYSIAGAEDVIASCRRVLDTARGARLPIAHFKRIERTPFFNPALDLVDWVEGLQPKPGEMVFEHRLPSCYSCEAFARFLGYVNDPLIVLAGFGANYTGLATAIDAFSRGHRMWLVGDATGSYGSEQRSNQSNHSEICTIASQFAEIVEVDQVIGDLIGFERQRLPLRRAQEDDMHA